MNVQDEKQAIKELIAAYAETLNSADVKLISSFFCKEGQFMPDGFKTLQKTDLEHTGGSYLHSTQFHIDYDITDVMVDNRYAFVEATATVLELDRAQQEKIKKSRDFFVLCKEEHQWKIYRYFFNNVIIIN